MHNKNETLSLETIALQAPLRPDLTPVLRNRDYSRMLEDLTKLDEDLRASGLETLAMSLALEDLDEGAGFARQQKRCEFAIYAMRAELLRQILGTPSFESFSVTLSTSDLFSDFCGCRHIDGIRWTSKSTLHRASTFFDEAQLRQLNDSLVKTLGGAHGENPLGLEQPEDLSVCFVDSTCLEADIHFPVDWLLLRDVSITLLKAIALIRKEGLLCRMPQQSENFIRDMNKLSIEMTHARRRKEAGKARKNILRKMKKLLRRIGEHARRHRELLDSKFAQTDLSRAQANRIIARIDQKLELLPRVIEQAHERIIGGRTVKNKDKILSAHDVDLDVIVRGKAGAQVEFGNELFLSESMGGLLIDYKLYERNAPSEGLKMQESLERLEELELPQKLKTVVADRGFDGKGNEGFLAEHDIESMICPKDPQRLQQRLQDERFRQLQTRRGGTEARIGIFKNHTGSRVWRAKGLAHRKLAVGWSVLAHNLQWLARQVREQENKAPAPLAKSA